MIKAFAVNEKDEGLGLIGISAKNIAKMKEGKPMKIDMLDFPRPPKSLLVMYGETERDVIDALQGAGLIDPQMADRSRAICDGQGQGKKTSIVKDGGLVQ